MGVASGFAPEFPSRTRTVQPHVFFRRVPTDTFSDRARALTCARGSRPRRARPRPPSVARVSYVGASRRKPVSLVRRVSPCVPLRHPGTTWLPDLPCSWSGRPCGDVRGVQVQVRGHHGEVVPKGSPVSRGVSRSSRSWTPKAPRRVRAFVRDYEAHRDRVFDFVFVSVKTYDLPSVKAELDAHGITPKIAILVHNGIVGLLFDDAVRVVIPQSYDFVEEAVAREDAETGQKITVHVKNEEKPWVMPDRIRRAPWRRCWKPPACARSRPRVRLRLDPQVLHQRRGEPARHRRGLQLQRLAGGPRARMERLVAEEFVARAPRRDADAFAMLPEDFHAVVFDGLASYGEHFLHEDGLRRRTRARGGLPERVGRRARRGRRQAPAPENESSSTRSPRSSGTGTETGTRETEAGVVPSRSETRVERSSAIPVPRR